MRSELTKARLAMMSLLSKSDGFGVDQNVLRLKRQRPFTQPGAILYLDHIATLEIECVDRRLTVKRPKGSMTFFCGQHTLRAEQLCSVQCKPIARLLEAVYAVRLITLRKPRQVQRKPYWPRKSAPRLPAQRRRSQPRPRHRASWQPP